MITRTSQDTGSTMGREERIRREEEQPAQQSRQEAHRSTQEQHSKRQGCPTHTQEDASSSSQPSMAHTTACSEGRAAKARSTPKDIAHKGHSMRQWCCRMPNPHPRRCKLFLTSDRQGLTRTTGRATNQRMPTTHTHNEKPHHLNHRDPHACVTLDQLPDTHETHTPINWSFGWGQGGKASERATQSHTPRRGQGLATSGSLPPPPEQRMTPRVPTMRSQECEFTESAKSTLARCNEQAASSRTTTQQVR